MRSPLALIALIALCVSVGARADTDEPFNGAVHSDPGVGGRIVQELASGEIIKVVRVVGDVWMEVECRPGSIAAATAFLSKSKASARSIVRAADDEVAKQWSDQ